jgi:hypothetical protein
MILSPSEELAVALAPTQSLVETPSRLFYREAMDVLNRAEVPFLVGGAFAFIHQAGIDKSTKDLDLFARPSDVQRLLEACASAGYDTELVFSHWLAKIRSPEGFIDVIFSSGNGVAVVDDEWFAHAIAGDVLTVPVKIAPAEETLWSKAFVMERERYDGADVSHLILAVGDRLDWNRVLSRFGPYWRVLLSHLILFGFIYPTARSKVPSSVMRDLLSRLERELDSSDTGDPVCYGTLLSWSQYLGDVLGGSFRDARVRPYGNMSGEEVARWTSADKS